jgi:hypothetical protein
MTEGDVIRVTIPARFEVATLIAGTGIGMKGIETTATATDTIDLGIRGILGIVTIIDRTTRSLALGGDIGRNKDKKGDVTNLKGDVSH